MTLLDRIRGMKEAVRTPVPVRNRVEPGTQQGKELYAEAFGPVRRGLRACTQSPIAPVRNPPVASALKEVLAQKNVLRMQARGSLPSTQYMRLPRGGFRCLRCGHVTASRSGITTHYRRKHGSP